MKLSIANVDAVLPMGPLCHISARDQRLAALREVHRVLKPGGLLVATAISLFASLLHGIRQAFIDDPTFGSMLRRDLEDGQHRGRLDTLSHFTTAFLHRPEELEGELHEAGYHQQGLYAVEGPGEMAPDLDDRMSNPRKREQLLGWIRSVEQEKTLLGASSHSLVVTTK
ncbi:MAG: class I SAM-dependent methyltransferase [Dehalococcoidia bacterium]|nr:class I SAM-dependent methyltransferase [Dehalococcoidia bacterium]